MRVKLINSKGEMYLLPIGMAVQGYPVAINLPGVEIPGRPGRIIDRDLISMEVRDVFVNGTIEGLDKDDADRLREEIAKFVNHNNPLKLYRYENSNRYITVYLRDFNHAYHVGRFGGRLFTLNISFEAADPFFYADILQKVLKSITASGTTWQVNQPGTVDKQQPVIFITVRTGALVNPKLTMDDYSVECAELITTSLYLDSEKRIALLTNGNLDYYLQKMGQAGGNPVAPTVETNVINSISGSWLHNGFPLSPGNNEVTYTDDTTSDHQADVCFIWRPQYY